MIVFPNCKINLGLHILQKRADGFHNLETVFYPVALQDALEVIHSPDKEPDISLSGMVIEGKKENNICFKAYQLVQTAFPQLPPVHIHLHKVIPTGAGLGGGSADGAFMLLLLNKKFQLGLTENQLINYALQLGSDCPFFIKNTPCYATGRGENLQEFSLDLSAYRIAIIHPQIHVATGWAFSQITPHFTRTPLQLSIQKPVTEWKDNLINDFEDPVFRFYPEIKEIKNELYHQGAIFASMSGSGSAVFGIFPKESVLHFSFPPHYFVHAG